MRYLSNFITAMQNKLTEVFICSWKGHDLTEPYCFRCWLYCPEKWANHG